MKKLILAALLVAFNSFAGVAIVSDFDDTIKITMSGGEVTDFLKDKVFTGMPEFLKGARDYSNSLYVVSASPAFLRPKIAYTLKKHKISYKNLFLRVNLTERTFDYKVRIIKKLINSTSDDFILIGDDLQYDPEVYKEIKRLYPERILAIYIHTVKGRKKAQYTASYWTSFDLFLQEFEQGRMTPGWVEMIFDKLMAENNLEFIFPKKAYCPTSATIWEWQTRTIFMHEAQKLIERFTTFCQARRSGNILL